MAGDDLAVILGSLLYTLSYAFIESSHDIGTVGKVPVRIAVVDGVGERFIFWRAVGRNAGKNLSVLIIGVGHLMIFWEPQEADAARQDVQATW
jgi:uncharacterized RDD family membrane protein YckC